MSFSKIASIALYIVVGISVLVIAFFYLGENLVDAEALQAKIDKMNAPEQTFSYQADLQETAADTILVDEADSSGISEAETDTSAVTEEMPAAAPVAEEVPEAPEVEEVSLTFMENLVSKRTDVAIVWAYILVIVTLLVALVFSVAQMFTNTKALIRGLIVLAGIAVLVGIAYALSSDTPLQILGYEGTDNKDPGTLKMVDTGLIMTYFVLAGIVVAIFYSEIAKYFK